MIFSRVCRVCGRELVNGEKKICLHCVMAIPAWKGMNSDLRAHRLPRTAPIDGVWPWLTYSNADPVCALIREGKFNDRPELIEELGRRYAAWLKENGLLEGVDALIPVPMHWWKRLRRGYNQSELIANAIANASGIPISNALKVVRRHSVQSRQSGLQRAANVAGIFALSRNHGLTDGTKVALVDDILTTGSTLSEAVNTLSEAPIASITILPLAAVPNS